MVSCYALLGSITLMSGSLLLALSPLYMALKDYHVDLRNQRISYAIAFLVLTVFACVQEATRKR